MRKIVVKKDHLLEVLRDNRYAHEATYNEAITAFREMAIEKLECFLEDVRAGGEVPDYLGLTEPVSHSEDYNRVIDMLTMDVADTVELDEQEFSQYVQDNWHWKRDFVRMSSTYIAQKKR